MSPRVAFLAVLLMSCGAKEPKGASPPPAAAPPSYEEAIQAIAADIEGLKGEYPQLAEFSAAAHCEPDRLVVSYGYRTHQPEGRGGWAGAVPNPDDDGVWFYIDFHDPDSTAQIHTQPVVPPRRFRDKKVMFLILEGAQTKPLAGALEKVLAENGVTAE